MRENYKAIIANRIQTIAMLTNMPLTREDAKKAGAKEYLYVNFASCYGGYELMKVTVVGGGQDYFSWRNNTRLPAAAFVEMLDALIFGLEWGRK